MENCRKIVYNTFWQTNIFVDKQKIVFHLIEGKIKSVLVFLRHSRCVISSMLQTAFCLSKSHCGVFEMRILRFSTFIQR